MSDLRAQVVEAMAAVLYPWIEVDVQAAEAALDAALDLLEERREDWIEAEAQARLKVMGTWYRLTSANVERLLAVLRADPEDSK